MSDDSLVELFTVADISDDPRGGRQWVRVRYPTGQTTTLWVGDSIGVDREIAESLIELWEAGVKQDHERFFEKVFPFRRRAACTCGWAGNPHWDRMIAEMEYSNHALRVIALDSRRCDSTEQRATA